jgi:ferric-dicitrate binding protein FerR (iron transport regulator)
VDHFVTLDRLPEGLTFPPDLADRLHFDPERRRLSFRGFMSKADYDRILELSEDWAYRRKLEELFRLCVSELPMPSRRRGALTAAAIGLGLALLAGLGWVAHHTWSPRVGNADQTAATGRAPSSPGTIASARGSH